MRSRRAASARRASPAPREVGESAACIYPWRLCRWQSIVPLAFFRVCHATADNLGPKKSGNKPANQVAFLAQLTPLPLSTHKTLITQHSRRHNGRLRLHARVPITLQHHCQLRLQGKRYRVEWHRADDRGLWTKRNPNRP